MFTQYRFYSDWMPLLTHSYLISGHSGGGRHSRPSFAASKHFMTLSLPIPYTRRFHVSKTAATRLLPIEIALKTGLVTTLAVYQQHYSNTINYSPSYVSTFILSDGHQNNLYVERKYVGFVMFMFGYYFHVCV